MAGFNTRNYAWAACEIRLNGRILLAVQGVAWNTKQAKDYIYGKGDKPLKVQRGNKSTDGTLTVTQDELEAILDECPNGQITDLEDADLQIAFSDKGAIVRYSIIGVSFTEEPHDHKNGDPVAISQIPFIALDATRV